MKFGQQTTHLAEVNVLIFMKNGFKSQKKHSNLMQTAGVAVQIVLRDYSSRTINPGVSSPQGY